jgi:hypothetical protein
MLAQSAQSLINASVYPVLARRHAQHGPQVAFSACARTSIALLIVGALMAMLLWPLLLKAIHLWYPDYADVETVVPLFLFAGVLRLSDFWSSLLLVAGRERVLLRINVATLGLAFAAWSATGFSGEPADGLRSVAWLAAWLAVVHYGAVASSAWAMRRR